MITHTVRLTLRNIVYAGFDHILFVKELVDSQPEK